MAVFPPSLIDAVKEQRAVLFLGAGASRGASHPKGDVVPDGETLRDLICDRFLGGQLKRKPLTAVAAMAANEAGLIPFQKFIHDLLEPFGPSSHHLLIPTFRWKAIVTTNYDLIVERAYENKPESLQRLVKTVKDGDEFDSRLSATAHPVGYYKLHGSIDRYTDETIPLILSNEQYKSYIKNRTHFYGRFRDLCREYSVIFAGYSISDPHIQDVLFDLTAPDIDRPMYFNISPGVSDIEQRYWAKNRVACIDATFEEFLRAMDQAIPTVARQLVTSIGGGSLSIKSHYRVAGTSESSTLRAFLETDVTHVHAAMLSEAQDAREFYKGNAEGWGGIQQNLDVKRSFTDSVLVDAILVPDEATRPSDLFMLKGPAGNGKTVALKRIAWEAATIYEQLVLYVNNASGLAFEPLEEIFHLTGKRIILCVDHVALFRTEALALLKSSRSRNVPLTILGTERDNEWNIYCDNLEPFVRQDFPVRYLSQKEIEDLIGLLERHRALGMLQDRSREERIHAFVNHADRQLLVALHEITLGVPFEDIVLDEYIRIEPALARSIYLSICALHQFGAPVRAGLISRSSGIPFARFKAEFLSPLQNVVHVIEDRHSGDVFYRARHQHVAEMVFRRALPAQEDKFDLLAALVSALNVDYSSDRETFSRLIKGRGVQEVFPNIELGRLFYDRVEEASPNDPFVFHQRAVFELSHPGGSLLAAEAAARRAFELNSYSRGIKHTQGEIARRLANETDDPLRKEAYRRFAREKIGNEISKLGELDLYTRAKLSIDELREEVEKAEHGPDGPITQKFVEAVRDAETAISRALQSYPDSPEILAVEATFHEVLDRTKEAQSTLEKAFRLNPRQDWLAVRLARRYHASDHSPKAMETLEACLRDNPSSKSARFAYARILIDINGDSALILDHLKRAFTEGDNNYEAQFWYGRQLFLDGRFVEAQKVFDGIHSRAPGRFRHGPAGAIVAANGGPLTYLGRIERLEDSYAFVRITQFPKAIFASKADSSSDIWAALRPQSDVKCNVAFSRRGPRAINVRIA